VVAGRETDYGRESEQDGCRQDHGTHYFGMLLLSYF
jgi:hypothetical protein